MQENKRIPGEAVSRSDQQQSKYEGKLWGENWWT